MPAVMLLPLLSLLASCGESGDGGDTLERGDSLQSSGPIARGPQVALVTENSIVIAWLTPKAVAGSVEYGLDEGLGNQASDSLPTTEHVITLAGLLPDSFYFYRIVLDSVVVSEGHSFSTAPNDASTPFRFDVFADLGQGLHQSNIAAKVLASEPALVLVAGDLVYNTGSPSAIDPRYFLPYAHLIDHIPFYAALGNHDVKTLRGQPLLDALYLPANDEDGTERFYSFDCGNVHFAALDSNSDVAPGSAQNTWLERDLSKSSSAWTVVFFHHPPFNSLSGGSNLRIRSGLEPIFDRHHVDIVFSGHIHDYERTLPLREATVVGAENDPDYINPEGTIYIVTGGGGRGLYGHGRSYFTAYSESTHHFTQVDVNGQELTVQAIREDGSVMDRMTIRKS